MQKKRAQRKPFDHRLKLRQIKIEFLDGTQSKGTAEGNNATWTCECGELLLGRCYFAFGDYCHTTCAKCGKTYYVKPDSNKKARVVVEGAA